MFLIAEPLSPNLLSFANCFVTSERVIPSEFSSLRRFTALYKKSILYQVEFPTIPSGVRPKVS